MIVVMGYVMDRSRAVVTGAQARATVDIVVPVYNEEHVLERSIGRLRCYLDQRFPFSATVIIADNASTDGTWEIASRLAAGAEGIGAVRLPEKGRGRALRAVWTQSDASVVAYMDVDLATDLDGLLPLVAPLLSGHSDVAIGSRLAHGARVVRGPRREIISRVYNLLIRTTMRSGFTDAQCGFKALRADAARQLLPLVTDQGWFFDTELLVLAEANGMRIHEVPVDWVDDPDSRVDVVRTAVGDLKGLVSVAHRLAAGNGRSSAQTGAMTAEGTSRFAGIGGLSTLTYLLLLLGLRPVLGILTANAVALSLAATGNFTAHRRFTLGRRGSRDHTDRPRRRAFIHEAVGAWAAGLVLSTLLLAGCAAFSSSLTPDLIAVVASNTLVSIGRFVNFRGRMGRHSAASSSAPGEVPAAVPAGRLWPTGPA